jgi:hypothetical protein
MKRSIAAAVLVLGLLIANAGQGEGKASTRFAPLLDSAEDRIVRSEFVPSEALQQGEVRLIRRGGAAVMQTVLYTRFLKRVVAEIRRKDLAAWPETREGHADSLRYIDALMEASSRILQRYEQRENRGDRHQKLLIEFILSERAALVAFYEPELEKTEGHNRIAAKHLIAVLELSRAYVRGDIYEIAWDALKLTRKESVRLLEPMLPAEREGDSP